MFSRFVSLGLEMSSFCLRAYALVGSKKKLFYNITMDVEKKTVDVRVFPGLMAEINILIN